MDAFGTYFAGMVVFTLLTMSLPTIVRDALVNREVEVLDEIPNDIDWPDQRIDRNVKLIDKGNQVTVNETFRGVVEKIEGTHAYIVMENQTGDRLCGSYAAKEFSTLGIGERDLFTLQTIEVGDDIRIEIKKLPSVGVSVERQRQILAETDDILGNFDPQDDY